MTAPGPGWNDGTPPDGALTGDDLGALDGLNEATYIDGKKTEIMDRWQPGHDALQLSLGDVIGNITDAIFGNYTGSVGPLIQINDKQLTLSVDDLMGAPGYCFLTMGKNWRVGSDSAWIPLPFDTYIGPSDGATRYYGSASGDSKFRYGIELTKGGLWVLDGRMTLSDGTGSPSSNMRIRVREWNGSSWSDYTEADYTAEDADNTTHQLRQPVVLPDTGTWGVKRYVAFFEWQIDVLWWTTYGGPKWSGFSAIRMSRDSGSQPSTTVPDGGDYT